MCRISAQRHSADVSDVKIKTQKVQLFIKKKFKFRLVQQNYYVKWLHQLHLR